MLSALSSPRSSSRRRLLSVPLASTGSLDPPRTSRVFRSRSPPRPPPPLPSSFLFDASDVFEDPPRTFRSLRSSFFLSSFFPVSLPGVNSCASTLRDASLPAPLPRLEPAPLAAASSFALRSRSSFSFSFGSGGRYGLNWLSAFHPGFSRCSMARYRAAMVFKSPRSSLSLIFSTLRRMCAPILEMEGNTFTTFVRTISELRISR